jgi:Tfp pilus assembly protein PilV
MNNSPFGKHTGFTLIELVIGMTILVIGVVSIFSLAVFSIHLNQENMTKVQAIELAREGLEMVRNIRDSNWKNNYPFTGGADKWGASFDTPQTVIISPSFAPDAQGTVWPWKVSPVLVSETTKETYRLKTVLKGGVPLFTHEDLPGAVNSPFYRYISVTPQDDHTLEVTATVLWSGKRIDLTTLLTNWKKI